MTSEEFMRQHAEIFKEYNRLIAAEYAAKVQSFVGKYYSIGDFWGYKKYIHIIRPKGTYPERATHFFVMEISVYEFSPTEVSMNDLKEYSEVTREVFLQAVGKLESRISAYKETETYDF